jgi:phosphoglucosamine mutase
MNIFGSDGFRCQFGTSFMNATNIINFVHALGKWYLKEDLNTPIVIGRDTRASGKIVKGFLISILNYMGINIIDIGIIPSPGMSNLLPSFNAALGVMITASHNPAEDNGIKLFSPEGAKFDVASEKEIETFMHDIPLEIKVGAILGKTIKKLDQFSTYVNAICDSNAFQLTNNKLLIDCSNGAFSELSSTLGKSSNISFVNDRPDGHNINLDAGALEADKLLLAIREMDFDYGVAFDGDGDRAVFVSKEYGVIETEKLACLFFQMHINNTQLQQTVVASEIVNLSFALNIENLGGKTIETSVGDRYVIDATNNHKAIFGFEPSGHFFFPQQASSMDGLLALTQFINLQNTPNGSIDDKLKELTHATREQKNINVDDLHPDFDCSLIQNEIQNSITPRTEKIVIRKSMWDPVIRVYYDYVEENRFPILEHKINHILSSFRK